LKRFLLWTADAVKGVCAVSLFIPTHEDVEAASKRLQGVTQVTPLDYSKTFSTLSGNSIYLKLENLQKTGSFKLRGAFNKIACLSEEERNRGVIAASAGNHAQGVAYAARYHNAPCTIVMPESASLAKVSATQGYGANVVLAGASYDDAYAHALQLQKEHGYTYVHAFDDPFVIAGQGTVGREIAEDMAALGIAPDIVVAPASGGGLIAGVATAIKARYPQAMVMSGEPEGFDDHARSLRAGKREPHDAKGRTICDALMAAIPGEITFAINSRLLTQGITASDAEVGTAVAFAFRELKLVVEPGGAVGLAALLAGRIDARGKNIVIVLSGGNVDADLYARLIN
jgi:threonine dehydratase